MTGLRWFRPNGMDAGLSLLRHSAVDERTRHRHASAMATIGERAPLIILAERPHGLILDAGPPLGQVLLPRAEMPRSWNIGDTVEAFLHHDSEDRPVATLRRPLAMPGSFALLTCVATTPIGAFLDWGLAKDLFVPFREQKNRMEPGKRYLVHVHIDSTSGRIIASGRISRHLTKPEIPYPVGSEIPLLVHTRTPLGYKVILEGRHEGLLFADDVFEDLRPGDARIGYIRASRPDGRIDVSLQPPGRTRIDDTATRILAELAARGGFLPMGDHSPAEEIRELFSCSKRSFKQAVGALLRSRRIRIEATGLRLLEPS